MDRHTQERTNRMAQMAEAAQAPRLAQAAALPQNGIPFETALPFLKLGYKAQRAGWNGKGMHIEVVTTWGIADQTPRMGSMLPFLMMRTAQGDWVPWLASQTDILAHDWAIVDDAGVEIVHGAGVGATPLGNQ